MKQEHSGRAEVRSKENNQRRVSERGSTIIVHKHEAPYVMLSKSITDGKTGLSLKATAILCYLLGKPDGWRTWVSDIANRFPDGDRAIRSGLNELRYYGYADLEPIRTTDGVCGTVWRISDKPIFLELERTRKFRLQYMEKTKRPEIAVSSNSRNVKLTKCKIDETSDSRNGHHSNDPLNSNEPEPTACSPRRCRVDQNHQQQRRAGADAKLPLPGLSEKAEGLKAEWSRCHQIVFGTKPAFSPTDHQALEEFIEAVPGTVQDQIGVVLFAWSAQPYDNNGGFNPYFHANTFSRMPSQWMRPCGCKKCGGALAITGILSELLWRARPEQYERAFTWLERQAGRRQKGSKSTVVDEKENSHEKKE